MEHEAKDGKKITKQKNGVKVWGGEQWRTQELFRGRGSTNSVEDRGQRERGSGGGSPLVGGSTQFANK
jgi:hypothetical protein